MKRKRAFVSPSPPISSGTSIENQMHVHVFVWSFIKTQVNIALCGVEGSKEGEAV